jgi:hypothetical protein
VPSTNDDGAKKSIFSTIVGYIDTLRGTWEKNLIQKRSRRQVRNELMRMILLSYNSINIHDTD